MAELDELFGNEKQTTIEPYSKDDWIKQRNENRALAYEMLEAATDELNNPDTVMAYLDIQSKFDRYSVSNALLVAYQNPEATRLCDSKTWQKNHVFINKGETGIIILEPGKEYTRDDGKTVIPYNAKKVFDISQTNAKPRQNNVKTPDARVVVKAMITTSIMIIIHGAILQLRQGSLPEPGLPQASCRRGRWKGRHQVLSRCKLQIPREIPSRRA